MALSAAKLNPQAHILDTLAEAYHVNGRNHEALATARQSLHAATENRDYYLRQVQRFQKALKGVIIERPEIGEQ